MTKKENKPLWFVTDYYLAAGRPKLENAIMDHARQKYLHCLVRDLDQMVEYLERFQDKLWEENKRLKKVEIRHTYREQFWGMPDNIVWLKIGQLHLILRKVRTEVEVEL